MISARTLRFGKWLVVTLWLAAAVAAVPSAQGLGDVMDNEEANWLPAAAQSTRALELIRERFPAEDTTALTVVYAREGGLTTADEAVARTHREQLASLAAEPIAPPVPSRDGAALLLSVPVPVEALESGEVNQIVARARDLVRPPSGSGLTVLTTGPAASRADASAASGAVDRTLLVVTVAVVAVVLLLTYRSPLLPLLALACVGVAAVVAQAAVSAAARHGLLTVNGTSAVLLTVLVFGVGTDYALLLISRYREELRRTADHHVAVATAVRRSFAAVTASAATVVAALAVLLLAAMNSTRGLGPVAAIGVAAAMLTMTTLLPAALALCGRRVFWPRVPRLGQVARPATWNRIAGVVGRHPRRVWLLTALSLGVLATGVLSLTVGGYRAEEAFTRQPEFVKGQRLLARHFPSGTTSPVRIVTPARFAEPVAEAARRTGGVSGIEQMIASVDGEWVIVPAVLGDDPDSAAARDTLHRLRERVAMIDPGIVVGGRTAAALDQHQATTRDLKLILPLSLVVVMLVIGLLLRAVLGTLVLVAAVILSAGAGLGAASMIFNLLGYPRADPTVLMFGFLFLVALGVDYSIFLMARAREEAVATGHGAGVLRALAATGGVITSAGLVLAATFAVLTVTPVVLNLQLGILVAVGILLDALVVRSLLVPALALHIGRRTWWPGL